MNGAGTTSAAGNPSSASSLLCDIAGTAWEPTPWRAVQRAAWEVLMDN
jgi:hypothetical protein